MIRNIFLCLLIIICLSTYGYSFLTWNTLTPMPLARSDFEVISYANSMYIMGGCIRNQSTNPVNGSCPLITNRFEMFSTITNEWTELTASPNNRTQYQAALVGSTIYYIGGRDEFGNLVPVVDTYDISTSTWTTLPDQGGVTSRSNGVFLQHNNFYFDLGVIMLYNSSLTCRYI